jgi:hypothetical protein
MRNIRQEMNLTIIERKQTLIHQIDQGRVTKRQIKVKSNPNIIFSLIKIYLDYIQ